MAAITWMVGPDGKKIGVRTENVQARQQQGYTATSSPVASTSTNRAASTVPKTQTASANSEDGAWLGNWRADWSKGAKTLEEAVRHGTYGVGNNSGGGVAQPSAPQSSPMSLIDQLNAARKAATLASLQKSRDSALSNLNAERGSIAPKYYDARNQVAAGSQQQARNLAEYMANRGGTRSGAAAQAEISRQGNLQGNLGQLGRQETQAFTDIARRMSDVSNAYASDVASAEAGIEADRMNALLNDYYQQQQRELQLAQLMGNYNGNRTLAGQQFDWQTSMNNPSNIGQNLDNAYRYTQLQYLPQQLQQQAKLIDQQLASGSINQQTAEYNYKQLTDPNSPVNQKQNIELQLAQLELQNAPQEYKLRLQQLQKQISEIGKAPYRSQEEVEMDKVKLETAREQLAQLRSSAGAPQGTADDYFDVINKSPYMAPVMQTDDFGKSINTGRVQVTNQKGLESFILSLGLNDQETTKLYQYYNLPLPGRPAGSLQGGIR